jgi:hypothetical protein
VKWISKLGKKGQSLLSQNYFCFRLLAYLCLSNEEDDIPCDDSEQSGDVTLFSEY